MAGDSITEGMLTLKAADGFSFEAFRASPAQGRKGGLVILQEIFGLTDQLKGVVRSYARDGYDTIIPCLYDRVAPGTMFLSFHQPETHANRLVGPEVDPISKCPAYKVVAVRVSPAP